MAAVRRLSHLPTRRSPQPGAFYILGRERVPLVDTSLAPADARPYLTGQVRGFEHRDAAKDITFLMANSCDDNLPLILLQMGLRRASWNRREDMPPPKSSFSSYFWPIFTGSSMCATNYPASDFMQMGAAAS